MNTYRVWYSIYADVEADDANEAMNIAAEIPMDMFVFDFAEVEEIEED